MITEHTKASYLKYRKHCMLLVEKIEAGSGSREILKEHQDTRQKMLAAAMMIADDTCGFETEEDFRFRTGDTSQQR